LTFATILPYRQHGRRFDIHHSLPRLPAGKIAGMDGLVKSVLEPDPMRAFALVAVMVLVGLLSLLGVVIFIERYK
jgi:hypothetical protein